MAFSDFQFLPQPRQLTWPAGTYPLAPGKLIVLDVLQPQPLLPAARRLRLALQKYHRLDWEIAAGGSLPAAQVGIRFRLLPEQVRRVEGYLLKVTPTGIEIQAHDPAGAFYGACTLEQLLQQVGEELPGLQIQDWPDFAARGIMLDISRDKVYSQETLYQLVDQLAGFKINQIQLYTEHTFAYRNHPVVWEKASPMTGAEILALDAFCRERFVELVPNQNSFGHMERWLKHPQYISLAEVTGEYETPWGTAHGPNSLCPEDPGSLALIESLYDELLPHFSSRMVNIGCDETHDLGHGRSREICQARGPGQVYLDFLLKIYQNLKRRGFRMQFWGDIIIQHPELVPSLPGDLIALEWGYEADHPFAEHGAQFAAAGIPFYVCPGTSAWNSLGGRTKNALENLRNAAENGLRYGACGYLNTDWGDSGHWQALPISTLGFSAGAAYSWCYETNRNLDLRQAVSRFAFGDPEGAMGDLVYDLGNVYQVPEVVLHNSSALFWALKLPLEKIREQGQKLDAGFQDALSATGSAIRHLERAKMDRLDADLVRAEFRLTARLMQHACQRGLLAFEEDPTRAATLRQELYQDMQGILSEYKRIWLERNRPGGLADSIARFEALLAEYH